MTLCCCPTNFSLSLTLLLHTPDAGQIISGKRTTN